jgi:hypothetical protein
MHRIFSGEACLSGASVVRNRVSKCLGGGHDGARALLNTMHDEILQRRSVSRQDLVPCRPSKTRLDVLLLPPSCRFSLLLEARFLGKSAPVNLPHSH